MAAARREAPSKWDITVLNNRELLLGMKNVYEAKSSMQRSTLIAKEVKEDKELWGLPAFHSGKGYVDGLYNPVN